MTRKIMTVVAGAALLASAGSANAGEEKAGTPEILNSVDVAAYQQLSADDMADVVGTFSWYYTSIGNQAGWYNFYQVYQNGQWYTRYWYYPYQAQTYQQQPQQYQQYNNYYYQIPPKAAVDAFYAFAQSGQATQPGTTAGTQ